MTLIPQNYRKVTELAELQCLLRELMYELHCICEENGLVYNLFWGSLLGAVRHQDMIPWDDDLDICMPRSDCEKLIRIVQEKYADRFEIYAYPRENYIYPFIKFCMKNSLLIERGLKPQYAKLKLYVDIFPIDGVPDTSEEKLCKRYAKAEKYKKRVCYCVLEETLPFRRWMRPIAFAKYLRTAVANVWGYKYFLKKQVEETARFSFETCDDVAFVSFWGGGAKSVIKKKAFLDRVLYKFGPYAFWGTRDYHYWLNAWYGDYMTLPSEDKRSAKHSYDLYVEASE